jgi:hypothetical protein
VRRTRRNATGTPVRATSPQTIWRACGLIVLTLRGNQVHAITRFADLGLIARFGFPRTLPRG